MTYVHLLGYCCHLRLLDFDLPSSSVRATNDTVGRILTNQNARALNDNNVLKMNINVIMK